MTDLTGWKPSAAIHGGSERNHVTIRAQRDRLSVAINGQPVFEATGSTFAKGDIGLGTIAGDRPTEVRFDNVVATTIH